MTNTITPYVGARRDAQKQFGTVDQRILQKNADEDGNLFSTKAADGTTSRKEGVKLEKGDTLWDVAEALYREKLAQKPDVAEKDIDQRVVYQIQKKLREDNKLNDKALRHLQVGQEIKIGGVDDAFVEGMKKQFGL